MDNNNEIFLKTLESCCLKMDALIEGLKNSEDILTKQKLFAVSSFLEFVKAGATVTLQPIQNKKATFLVNFGDDK